VRKIILILILLIFVIGCAKQGTLDNESLKTNNQEPGKQQAMTEESIDKEIIPQEAEQIKQAIAWKEKGAAIPGKYADADIIALGNGKYRMYYSAEPEIPGFKGQVYSALSSDGKSWVQEDGTRKEWATFPSVIKLPDGRYRMYFQNMGVIKSAVSSDGLIWQDEPGTRIGTENSEGVIFENVVAPTVINTGSEYVMVYGGAINEKYSAEKVPNSETHILMWATSQDGLAFEKKGIAVDSRNSVFKGWLDGPEFVNWDGETRLYFWSYRGIYHVAFSNNVFSEPEFDFTNSQDSATPFPPNPPGDPTLAKINGKWLMYYGQHEKGIYYAVIDEETIKETQEEKKESVNIPINIEENCIGFLTGNPQEAELINSIGAAWARPHSGPFAWGWIEPKKGEFDFGPVDEWVEKAQENKVAILATIWPYADWDQEQCHSSSCEVASEDQFYPWGEIGGIPKSRCMPCSPEDYKAFLSKLVERYDGDGIDDMPSLLIPIRYYEILNEPEMKEPDLTFYKGTEEEYVEILKLSNEAIKSVCPECKIVQGGAAGIRSDMLSYWEKIFDLGGADYFDIANIHYINLGDLNTLNVKDFKKLMQEKNIDKPIWVTEAEYGSEEDVEISFKGALNAGASKIFFTRFKIGQKKDPSILNDYSKVYDEIKCQ